MPNPEITIVTALHPDRAKHIDETAESIQELRKHLEINWVLAWDGEPAVALDGPDYQIQSPRNVGISACRNLTLPYITTEFTTPLDGDDLIRPAGVIDALDRLRSNLNLGWISLNRTLVDGTRTPHWRQEPCQWRPGELAEDWTAPFPFHPNSVVFRTDLLYQIGGWPAVATNEDLFLALQMSESALGESSTEILTRYRKWDLQEVADPNYTETKKQSFSVIATLISAQRQKLGRPPVSPPAQPGGAFGIGV